MRYSSHLQVSMLHQVAPTKVKNPKNSCLKNVFVPKMFLVNFNPKAALYEDSDPWIEVGLQLY